MTKFVISDKRYLDDVYWEFRAKLIKILEQTRPINKSRQDKDSKYMYADKINIVVEVNEEP